MMNSNDRSMEIGVNRLFIYDTNDSIDTNNDGVH